MNKKRRNNQTHVSVKLSTNENVPWMIALSCTKYLNTFRIHGIHAKKTQVFRNIENKLTQFTEIDDEETCLWFTKKMKTLLRESLSNNEILHFFVK